jgi:hypothetical protein
MAQALPPPEMKDTLLDVDWSAKRLRVGKCGAVVLVALILAVAGKLTLGIPLAIPAMIARLLGKGN